MVLIRAAPSTVMTAESKQELKSLISNHAELGKLSAVYSLLIHDFIKVTEKDEQILVESPDYNAYFKFNSEFDVIVWFYERIESAAKNNVDWLKKHQEAFNAKSATTDKDKGE